MCLIGIHTAEQGIHGLGIKALHTVLETHPCVCLCTCKDCKVVHSDPVCNEKVHPINLTLLSLQDNLCSMFSVVISNIQHTLGQIIALLILVWLFACAIPADLSAVLSHWYEQLERIERDRFCCTKKIFNPGQKQVEESAVDSCNKIN